MMLYYYMRHTLFTGFFLLVVTGSLSGKTFSEQDGLIVEVAGNYESVTIREDVTIDRLLSESNVNGGLIVHVGCGTGERSADLAEKDNFIIQGLNRDGNEIEQARQHARSLDLDNKLTFRKWNGDLLPYTDNLVNILFWDTADSEEGMAEILRVLVPNGVAYIKQSTGWEKVIKPWSDEMDEWPHYRYDAGNTGASKDKIVGPPNHIQWEAGPRFMRSHEIETGISSILTANGRLYYILDEGPTGITDARFPAKWSLVCRDAFNGVTLWKRPMSDWGWQAWSNGRENDPIAWHGLRTRPPDVDRIMVAGGDTLYVTLGFGAPVSAVDGKTGEILMTYEETGGVIEFIYLDGLLLVHKDQPAPVIMAVRPRDGKVLWQKESDDIIINRSLSASGEQVYFHNRREIVSIDLGTGHTLWSSETEIRPTAVIAHKDAVLVMSGAVTMGFSSKTGKKLWDGPGAESRGRYPDVFVVEDVVWSGRPNFDARNINTGEIFKKMDLQKVLESGHHRRCYTDRATVNFMITGERGSEFLDLHEDNHQRNNWFRGACITGMLPANGLFYIPPHQCFCYPAVRMDGFFALSSRLSARSADDTDNPSSRLEKGPAYLNNPEEEIVRAEDIVRADDWPAYRQNARRSGSVDTRVPADLNNLWSVKIGGQLTQPVVAGGNVFVVQKETATVHALDLESGERIWSQTVSGSIDFPPTVHNGNVFIGSRDGFVYSFRANDGVLAWRYLVAPQERQIISYDRLESAWPVYGVLIHDGLLYAAAGRSGFMDGGIYLYALDPDSGEPAYRNKLEGPFPDINEPSYAFHKDGYRSDLLTTDGNYIYMGRTMLDRTLQVVDPERITMVGTQRGDILEYRIMPGMRLVATGSFMDDSFFNRTWWMYSHIWPGFHYAQQAPKSGQMLVFDDRNTYTVKHYSTRNRHSPMLFPGSGYLLFADDNHNEPLFYRGEGEPRPIEWEPELPEETRWSIYQNAGVDKGPGFTRSQPARWTSWVDVRIEAMVLAGDKLFFAGTPDLVPDEDPLAALEGRMGGLIQVVSVNDGRLIGEFLMESMPVFDGLIATQSRLILSTQNGDVISLGEK